MQKLAVHPQRNGDPYDGNAPDRRAEPGQRIPDGGHRHTAERFDPHRRRKAGQDLGAKAVHHRLDKHLADRDRGLLQKGIVLGGNAKPLPGRFVVDVFASSSSIC